MCSQLNTGEEGNSGRRDWLSALLLQRGSTLGPRFVSFYRQLSRRPRPWRRQLRRKLAVTITGAALLLAMAGGPLARAEPIDTNAMITVVNGEVEFNNNGKCSLMEAIWNARSTNANNMKADCNAGKPNAADTVVLPSGGLFELTAAHNDVYGPTGLPVITSDVTIDGNGATIRRAGENWWEYPAFRILAVDANGKLTLNNTTLSNGYAGDWSPEYGGGAILSLGELAVSGSTISNNQAYSYSTGGGGLAVYGPTTITNSIIEGNSISNNGQAEGGGVYVGQSSEATITGSQILNNRVGGYFASNGAGISIAGNAVIEDSVITGNVNWGSEGSGHGGGVHVGGEATIISSTISDNKAAHYFEWYSYDWHPGLGGGLSNTGHTQVVNSTISGNEAGYGGGVSNTSDGQLTIIQSSIAHNNAYEYEYTDFDYDYPEGGSGGGIFSGAGYWSYNCASTTLRGVIVSGNTSDVQGKQILFSPTDPGICEDYGLADFTVNAFNVFGQNGAAGLVGLGKGATDIVPSVGVAAILSPLADNGGPTQTHALPDGSPALDLAPSASCTAAPVGGVDQRSEPRNANGTGGASANECDAGSFELAAAAGGEALLVSPSSSGTVGGVAFAPSDILKYDPSAGWSMYFDGSDVGITKNLVAFELLDNGDILMSFAANQTTPAGTFAAQDIARFKPTSTGNNTAGTFHWEFDGSANLLTTSGEKIDALGDLGGGKLALSTSGAVTVKLPGGAVLKAQDEDALGLVPATGEWSAYFDGTAVTGLKAEDVNALWIDPATGDLYITIVGSFKLGAVQGNGRDIVKLAVDAGAPGGYSSSLWWDGSAEGFPTNIDGLEILP